MDEYGSVLTRQRDLAFRRDTLALLERIAIALETLSHPLYVVEPDPPSRVQHQEVHHQEVHIEADFCSCGSDIFMTCSACSAARLAWVWKRRDEV